MVWRICTGQAYADLPPDPKEIARLLRGSAACDGHPPGGSGCVLGMAREPVCRPGGSCGR